MSDFDLLQQAGHNVPDPGHGSSISCNPADSAAYDPASPRAGHDDNASTGRRSSTSAEDVAPATHPLHRTVQRLQAAVDKDLARLDAG